MLRFDDPETLIPADKYSIRRASKGGSWAKFLGTWNKTSRNEFNVLHIMILLILAV